MALALRSPLHRGHTGSVQIDYTAQAQVTYVVIDGCPDEWPEVVTEVLADCVLMDTTVTGKPLGLELLFPPAELTDARLTPVYERWPELRAPLAKAVAGVGAVLSATHSPE